MDFEDQLRPIKSKTSIFNYKYKQNEVETPHLK